MTGYGKSPRSKSRLENKIKRNKEKKEEKKRRECLLLTCSLIKKE
jgi:hypothetical protein